MNWLLYYFARGFLGLIQALPLPVVALVGRFLGWLVYLFDARHRKMTRRNMMMCFGKERSAEEIHALAKENFKRIGENMVCAMKTLSMSETALATRLKLIGEEKLIAVRQAKPTSILVAIGHFGNFEMFAHVGNDKLRMRRATTYRGTGNEVINRLMVNLRERTGCLYFERRTDGTALKAAMRDNDVMLGLLSDQHSGQHGLKLPFLGHECNTTKSPAIFALRYEVPLFTAVCYRTSLARWTVEVGDEIPTHENGEPRPVAAIMLDVNRAFEVAVCRDPANWFWVHNRWKHSDLKTFSRKNVSPTQPSAESKEAAAESEES